MQQQQSQPQINRHNNNTNTGTPEQPANNNLLNETTKDKPILMTRRELTDPFGSDDDEEIQGKGLHLFGNEIMDSQNTQSGGVTPSLDPTTANVSDCS